MSDLPQIDQAFFDAFAWCDKCHASHHPSNTFCDGLRQPQLTVPTIHLNGTSRDVLQTAYAVAYTFLNEAIAKVQETAPNARDYYVQRAEAYLNASTEHEARLRALERVRDEILILHDSCDAGAQ